MGLGNLKLNFFPVRFPDAQFPFYLREKDPAEPLRDSERGWEPVRDQSNPQANRGISRPSVKTALLVGSESANLRYESKLMPWADAPPSAVKALILRALADHLAAKNLDVELDPVGFHSFDRMQIPIAQGGPVTLTKGVHIKVDHLVASGIRTYGFFISPAVRLNISADMSRDVDLGRAALGERVEYQLDGRVLRGTLQDIDGKTAYVLGENEEQQIALSQIRVIPTAGTLSRYFELKNRSDAARAVRLAPQIAQHRLLPSGQRNRAWLRDQFLSSIGWLVAHSDYGRLFFRWPHSELDLSVDTKPITMGEPPSPRVEFIDTPSFIGGKGTEAKLPLQALKAAGPYEMGDCPPEPTVLFVFPEEIKDQANRLFLSLKNGVGPFPGTERIFNFRLSAKQALRISGFNFRRGEPHGKLAHRYADAIDKQVQGLSQKPDIALVLHPRTDRWNKENAYLEAKYRLLCANIPVQSITLELLDNPQALQWSVGNIALALFAKMGGRPWAAHINSPLPSDSIIVGINRAFAGRTTAGSTKKVFGFATAFSNKGVYLETRLFPAADHWPEYLKTLESSLRSLITEWQERNGQPTSLIFHLQREMRRDEQDVVQKCLATAGNSLIREYAVLRLSDDSDMVLIDEVRRDSFTPNAGTLAYLAGHRALLQVGGANSGQSVGKIVTTSPLQLTKLEGSSGSPPLSVLASQVLALAYMNWRGFNSEAWPVSIDYPREFAKLLGRFSDANLDVTRLAELSVMKRPWFL